MTLLQKQGRSAFKIINYSILTVLALSCILPFFHVIAVSFSDNRAVSAGAVVMWPQNFTIMPYKYLLERREFWTAFLISVERVLIGGLINMLLIVLCAYPLSKSNEKFMGRTIYAWIFFFTMLFSGGLIPLYVLVKDLGLIDKIWALVLPTAVPVFSVILMLNFFRQIPVELEEAAYIDGASHWRTLWQIYVPVSLPSIATITLFTVIGHWNSWFDGIIFMNYSSNYPLQSYMQTVIVSMSNIMDMTKISKEQALILGNLNLKSAMIIVGTIPILLIYPSLQKFFVTGIVLGSVKG